MTILTTYKKRVSNYPVLLQFLYEQIPSWIIIPVTENVSIFVHVYRFFIYSLITKIHIYRYFEKMAVVIF